MDFAIIKTESHRDIYGLEYGSYIYNLLIKRDKIKHISVKDKRYVFLRGVYDAVVLDKFQLLLLWEWLAIFFQ
ncbi:hypothetical protein HUU40_24295 [candidate division KSB1 bacterium]|nr:hypothetical protein [candidate division KSB1 bacterium]